MKTAKLLVTICWIMLISSCRTALPAETPIVTPISDEMNIPTFDSEALNAFRELGREYPGIILSVRGASEEQVQLDSLLFQVVPGKPFKGYYLIGNYFDQGFDFLLIMMLDYEQIWFKLDGEKTFTHKFHLGGSEERIFSVDTPPLSEGFHDLLILVVRDPDNHSSDIPFRIHTAYYIAKTRVNIYVGNANPPRIDFTTFSETIADSAREGAFILSKQERGNIWEGWFTENTTPGEHVRYLIRITGDRKDAQPFALVAFWDYQQTPINGNDVLYGILKPNTLITIPACLIIPESRGAHEFFALYIANPYAELAVNLSSDN